VNRVNLCWQETFRPYYDNIGKFRCCPSARKLGVSAPPVDRPDVPGGGKNGAWGTLSADYGSYGINWWVYRPQCGITITQGRNTIKSWRTTTYSKDRRGIPLLLDAIWFEGAPEDKDEPPKTEGYWRTGHNSEMNRFCVDRHRRTLNILFSDMSTRPVGPKELWTLKWHREYNTRGLWTTAGGIQPEDWPAWMRKFKDY